MRHHLMEEPYAVIPPVRICAGYLRYFIETSVNTGNLRRPHIAPQYAYVLYVIRVQTSPRSWPSCVPRCAWSSTPAGRAKRARMAGRSRKQSTYTHSRQFADHAWPRKITDNNNG